MQSYYTFLALELANERIHEADRERLAHLAQAARPGRPSLARQGMGLVARLVEPVVAAIARKIDSYRSDEVTQQQASTE